MRSWTDAQWAHLMLRLTLGVNIAMHGLTRVIAGSGAFADKMTQDFAPSPLPAPLVWAFGAALPAVELGIGLLLLLGYRLRAALIAGAALMCALTFGTTLLQRWDGAGLQLIYALAYAALLAGRAHATLTLDGALARRGTAPPLSSTQS